MRCISKFEVLRWNGLLIAGTVAVVWASMLFAGRTLAGEAATDPAKASKSDAGAGPAAASQEPKAADAKAKTRKASKPRGRLPNHFAGVVNDEQREKIYTIQREFEPRISQLRRELESLTKARDQKIDEVLTPEQKKKIDDLKAAAKQSRGKKAAEPGAKAKKERSKKPAKGDAAAKAAPKANAAETPK